MACSKCGAKRGHLPGCENAKKKRGHPGGKSRSLGPKDIPKHKCEPEVEATRRVSHLTYIEKITFYRCKTCRVSMGSSTERENKL